jgi:hypothetical protein
LFHGQAGEDARDAFAREFGGSVPPNQPETDSLFWKKAMDAAREAHERREALELARRNAVVLEHGENRRASCSSTAPAPASKQ